MYTVLRSPLSSCVVLLPLCWLRAHAFFAFRTTTPASPCSLCAPALERTGTKRFLGQSDQPCPWRIFPPQRRQITLPQIMADPTCPNLRFKISVSSIDPCPPFRARPTGRQGYTFTVSKFTVRG